MTRATRGLVVLAKWPGAGRAKRRLGAAIGAREARRLAHAFLRDTATLAGRSGADTIVVAFAPPSAREPISRRFPGATLAPQPRGSFGTRLANALEAGRAAAGAVVLIGTDSPTLGPWIVRSAFAALAGGADCVLGPSHDGGYYLIGCVRPLPRSLFRDIPWGTPGVFALTRDRARAAGLRVTELPVWYDVDDADALALLRADLRGLRRAPATAAVLAG